MRPKEYAWEEAGGQVRADVAVLSVAIKDAQQGRVLVDVDAEVVLIWAGLCALLAREADVATLQDFLESVGAFPFGVGTLVLTTG